MSLTLGLGLFPHEPYGDASAVLDFATPYFRNQGRRTANFAQVVGNANPTANDKRVVISEPAALHRIAGGISTTVGTTLPCTVLDWNDGSDSNKLTISLNASGQLVLAVTVGGSTTTIATEGGSPAATRAIRFEARRLNTVWSFLVGGAYLAQATAGAPGATSLQIGNTRALTETINTVLRDVEIYVGLPVQTDFRAAAGSGLLAVL